MGPINAHALGGILNLEGLELPYGLFVVSKALAKEHHGQHNITQKHAAKMKHVEASAHVQWLRTRDLVEHLVSPGLESGEVYIRNEQLLAPGFIYNFYKGRGHNPMWSSADGLLPRGIGLLHNIYTAEPLGLIHIEKHHLMTIEAIVDEIEGQTSLSRPVDPRLIAELDVLLTDALITYSMDASQNKVSPNDIQRLSLVNIAKRALNMEEIEGVLIELASRRPSINNHILSHRDDDAVLPLPDNMEDLKSTLLNYDPLSTQGFIRNFFCRDASLTRKELGIELHSYNEVETFYGRRGFVTAWFDELGPLRQAFILARTVIDSPNEGLSEGSYHVNEIRGGIKSIIEAGESGQDVSREVAVLELYLTDAFLLYASHMIGGRSPIKTVYTQSIRKQPKINLAKVLSKALESHYLGITLKGLTPRQRTYRDLRVVLARHKSIQSRGGWGGISSGPTLKLGSKGRRVQELRERLAYTDYSAPIKIWNLIKRPGSTRIVFDEALHQSVIKFQARHGLATTGTVNAETLKELNVSVKERIEYIKVNMERWRWYSNVLGTNYIVVNTAGYTLEVIEDKNSVMKMDVIVGRRYTETPVFVSEIKHIVLNPFWHAPDSIAKGVIEPPGPKNPLGKIKFLFPNNFSIYLHDTPQKHLFKRRTRSFSHGCVRLGNAPALAEALLKYASGWTPRSLHKTLKTYKTRWIKLDNPVPIYILYWTSWVDENGNINFRKDIYDKDSVVKRMI